MEKLTMWKKTCNKQYLGSWDLCVGADANDKPIYKDLIVTVKDVKEDLVEDLLKNKHCSKPLEIQLQDKVEVTSDLKSAIHNAEIILSVVATTGTRSVCGRLEMRYRYVRDQV